MNGITVNATEMITRNLWVVIAVIAIIVVFDERANDGGLIYWCYNMISGDF